MSFSKESEDDICDYEPSDSDEDYNENEKLLLNNFRNRSKKQSDSEEEVLGVTVPSDSDQSDIALSDVEGQDNHDDDDLPNIRAWGKDKRKFYSTDYIDPDYGGYQEKDIHLAELEEEEAKNLQKQLAEQLNDDDFNFDIIKTNDKNEDSYKLSGLVIKTDFSKLSKRQKLQILKKESPELFGLIDDFQCKIKIIRDFLNPILEKYREGVISDSSALDFVITYQELSLNYCTNIYMYLLLIASKTNIANHPIVKRLYQYRQLLSQLNPTFDEIIKQQIQNLLNNTEDSLPNMKQLPNLNRSLNKRKIKENIKKPLKKVKFSDEIAEFNESDENLTENNDRDNVQSENNQINESGKRAITYQIAKNKGLTPRRKKEQRNPRVKHRNKYRKAKIRRKGAVREPRTELTRYSGEISGIKANVVKSIKIKS